MQFNERRRRILNYFFGHDQMSVRIEKKIEDAEITDENFV